MPYGQLLKAKRLLEKDEDAGYENYDHFDSDRTRIIFSRYFRTMQQKTQVFPLEMDRTVRTRLMHSLEVSIVGGRLARQIAKNDQLLEKEHRDSFICVVKNACLIHDIGNPPFGHFGEAAIKGWFKENCDTYASDAGLCSSLSDDERKKDYESRKKDFTEFNGNQQGIRLVMRTKSATNGVPMNLTYQTILSAIKYPRSCRAVKNKGDRKKEKAGYFCTEEANIHKALGYFGLDPDKRFCLSYIMEAADDISYCMSDIDDGLKKNIISHKEFVNEMGKELDRMDEEMKKKEEKSGLTPAKEHIFRDFLPLPKIDYEYEDEGKNRYDFSREIAARWSKILIDKVARKYWEVHEEIEKGTLRQLIADESVEGQVLAALKRIARKKLYLASEVVNLELSGLEIITGLLYHYGKLLKMKKDKFEQIVLGTDKTDVQRRIYSKVLGRFREGYKREVVEAVDRDGKLKLLEKVDKKGRVTSAILKSCLSEINPLEEWFLRAHMIVDHISAMTDDYALMQFNHFKGIVKV